MDPINGINKNWLVKFEIYFYQQYGIQIVQRSNVSVKYQSTRVRYATRRSWCVEEGRSR